LDEGDAHGASVTIPGDTVPERMWRPRKTSVFRGQPYENAIPARELIPLRELRGNLKNQPGF
jgi:hypothetical protein